MDTAGAVVLGDVVLDEGVVGVSAVGTAVLGISEIIDDQTVTVGSVGRIAIVPKDVPADDDMKTGFPVQRDRLPEGNAALAPRARQGAVTDGIVLLWVAKTPWRGAVIDFSAPTARFPPMFDLLSILFRALCSGFQSRQQLLLENLALRHQLTVLKRSVPRPKFKNSDRLFWLWLRDRTYPQWREWNVGHRWHLIRQVAEPPD